MQLWVAGFFKYVWPFLSPGIKGLNGETASIYSKVYIINKIGQLKGLPSYPQISSLKHSAK